MVLPAVTQHFDDLCVFLAVVLEDEFTLLVVVLVLASTPVLAALESVSVVAWRGRFRSHLGSGRVCVPFPCSLACLQMFCGVLVWV